MYQGYLLKCIIPTCIFTAIITVDERCSCPHYRWYTTNSITAVITVFAR